ncbi:MAG TPA: Mur ligase domain-containing protein [Chitinophagaceae bacterium]|nr:MAG: UDP-N-acetylmuramate--alanine ligase [Bacteroidetes bacterium OLB11]HMN32452.1 Mur ligase domain-containing protein [Chitinophagaceae bacterium]
MNNILSKNHFYFIGIAGAGMSAIAQYLSGNGKVVKGSDRLFASKENDYIKTQLEQENIQCFLQDGSGIDEQTEAVIVSTAIEDTNLEVIKAKQNNIPIIIRADLLAAICESKKTIALAGTSGKSTTTAMLFHILKENQISPSLITGAGLIDLQNNGKIGNAYCDKSDWLLIEADESDGTLVRYKPEIGVLLSVDKDHKEMNELFEIFNTFKLNCQKYFITNQSHPLAKQFSTNIQIDFGEGTAFEGKNFYQDGFKIHFDVQDIHFEIPTLGKHNMENALACIAVANILGVTIQQCANALKHYQGIYRRHQLLGKKGMITLIDDYAHNPAKIAASIKACQPIAPKLIAWFQPHGYGPTRFIRHELVDEIKTSLRPNDEIWMSEIYYAGGTTNKDISANELIQDLKTLGVNAHFVEHREQFLDQLLPTISSETVILLMGARDPSLEKFAKECYQKL